MKSIVKHIAIRLVHLFILILIVQLETQGQTLKDSLLDVYNNSLVKDTSSVVLLNEIDE